MKSAQIILFIILVLVISGVFIWKFLNLKEEKVFCIQDAKECPDGSFVRRVPPRCEFELCPGEKEGILISSPKVNEKIKSPLKIEGKAKGNWFFEGQFNAILFDADNNKLGEAILTAKGDWMKEDFVPFEGELNFIQPSTSLGKLKFFSANPSGLPEKQKIYEMDIQFAEVPFRKVLLFYYNPEKDKDANGNIKCSKDGLVAIEREIPVTKTPIQDTVNLLLKGKENLAQADIEKGITTEYPLEGFKLKSVNFERDGTLILEFEDPLNKTVGGSCRVRILWFQIEATAKQFPGVKQVKFLPERLFQP